MPKKIAQPQKPKITEPKKLSGFRRISDESVEMRTGKNWKEWFSILDKWDAKEKGHIKTAEHIRKEYHLKPWWAQAVVIRWEWARGMRRELPVRRPE